MPRRPKGGVEVQLYSFLTSTIDGGWVVNATFQPPYPWERDPVAIVWEAGWASEPVWAGAENISPTGIRSRDRPARIESLYRGNGRDLF
jgi:hypothetical protein